MQKFKTTLMDEQALVRAVRRISHEIVERNKGAEGLVLVGIKSRGVPLAKMIKENILSLEGVDIPLEMLDTSVYRDDIEKPDIKQAQPFVTDIAGKKVILVDDVLYTGRTARAAIEAVFTAGRPAAIQLAVLIDRGHRELPIRADYIGKNIPTSRSEAVAVFVNEIDGRSGAVILSE